MMKPWEDNFDDTPKNPEEENQKPWENNYSSSVETPAVPEPTLETPSEPVVAPKPAPAPYTTVLKDVPHTSLYENQDWLRSSRLLFKLQNGEDMPSDMSNEDVAKWGMDEMSAFNWNLGSMAFDAKRIHGADQETKEAFLYAMDQYEEVDHSWRTTGLAAKNLILDPTTLAGMITFGAAGASAQAAKVAGKQGLKAVLMESIKRTAAPAIVAGGVEGLAESSLRQSVEIDGGRRDEFSYGRAAGSTLLGATLGGVLGVGSDVAGAGLGALKREASELFSKKAPEVEAKAPKVDKDGQVVAPEADRVDVDYDNRPIDELVEEGVEEVVPSRPFSGEERVNVHNLDMFSHKYNSMPSQEEIPVAADMLYEQATKLKGLLLEGMLERIQRTVTAEDLPMVKETVAAARQLAEKEIVRLDSAIKKATEGDDTFSLWIHLSEAKASRLALNEIDSSLGSQSGRDLQARQKYGSPVKDINDPAQIQKAADKAFEDSVRKVTEARQPDIDKALNSGNNAEAMKLMRERDAAVLEEFTRFSKDLPKELDSSTFMGKFLEAQIGGVFSPTTVQYNVVYPALKTLLMPTLRAVTDPFSRASWVRGAKTYGAMRGAFNASMEAAKASWKYEQTFSTQDVSRVLEGGGQIKGIKGEIIRFFPRALAATDAFVSEQAAAGFMVGEAAEKAVNAGLKKGLKGEALNEYVDKNIEKAIKDGYERNITEQTIKPIVEKGKLLGLKGADLEAYVLKALNDTDSGALKRIKDTDTKDFVNDLLYKRDFGSDGVDRGRVGNFLAENITAYEQFTSKNKIIKVMGQLFLRTPIRVMEEGFRMTPLINTLMPNFKRDLAGRNGRQRQARAQAEIMVGYSVATYAMQAWAKGELKGSGSSDYKRQRLVGDSGEMNRLSIGSDDGRSKDISRLDPLRVPMTAVADAMDGMMLMSDREMQGAEASNKMLQGTSIAIASVVALFRDASLFGGVTEAADFGTKMLDVLSNEEKGVKDAGKELADFIADKAFMTIPATIKKGSKFVKGNDVVPNAFTLQQKLISQIAPSSNRVPKQYDVHGNMRTVEDPAQAFNMLDSSSLKEREKGKSKKELFVNKALNELMHETDSNIGQHPDKDPRFGDKRLTEIYTEVDGVEITVYDAVMLEYKKQGVTEILYGLLSTDAPVGNFLFDGAKTKAVKDTISKARKAALRIVISNDPKLRSMEEDYIRTKAQAGAGLFDLNR